MQKSLTDTEDPEPYPYDSLAPQLCNSCNQPLRQVELDTFIHLCPGCADAPPVCCPPSTPLYSEPEATLS